MSEDYNIKSLLGSESMAYNRHTLDGVFGWDQGSTRKIRTINWKPCHKFLLETNGESLLNLHYQVNTTTLNGP